MRTIKRQLRQFYASQGIGARRAEKLIKRDLNAVRRHWDLPHGPQPWHELAHVMEWHRTPQGWYYWASRQGCIGGEHNLHEHPSPLHA